MAVASASVYLWPPGALSRPLTPQVWLRQQNARSPKRGGTIQGMPSMEGYHCQVLCHSPSPQSEIFMVDLYRLQCERLHRI